MNHRSLFFVLPTLVGIAACARDPAYAPETLPVVRLTSPTADPTYTNGLVHVIVTVDPDRNLPVVLKSDGIVLATLAAPARTFDWDTTTSPEGPHAIVAEVTSSGKTAASAALTVLVDRTRPAVTSQIPAPGAVDVRFRAPVRVIFSEPIVLPQTGQPTFALSISGSAIPATATLDADNRGATIVVDDPTSVVLPATISLTIPSSITDRAGNTLLPVSGEWSWSVPDWIKYGPATASQMAIDASFRPVIAYHHGAGISVAVLDRGGGSTNYLPDIPNTLPNPPGFALAMDGQNRPVIAWAEPAAGGAPLQINFATWDGTAWDRTLPSIVPAAAGAAFSDPIMRLDGAARIVAAWKDTTGTWDFARSTGSDWERPFAPLAVGTEIPVDVALTGGGNPVVSWVELGDIGHVSIWNGAGWTATPTLPQTAARYLALDASGAPMLLANAAVHHLTDNGWQPVTTPLPINPSASAFMLTADSEHLPVVMWNQAVFRLSSLELARWTGTKWNASPELTPGSGGQVLVDRRDDVWILWSDQGLSWAPLVWMSNR